MQAKAGIVPGVPRHRRTLIRLVSLSPRPHQPSQRHLEQTVHAARLETHHHSVGRALRTGRKPALYRPHDQPDACPPERMDLRDGRVWVVRLPIGAGGEDQGFVMLPVNQAGTNGELGFL
jgi:hypothetical protein